jgi:hypothetical protein
MLVPLVASPRSRCRSPRPPAHTRAATEDHREHSLP